MPQYSFKCLKCKNEETRICKYEEIPNQKCDREILVIDKADIKSVDVISGGLSGTVQESHAESCGGQLERAEEIESGGVTPNLWKYGTA